MKMQVYQHHFSTGDMFFHWTNVFFEPKNKVHQWIVLRLSLRLKLIFFIKLFVCWNMDLVLQCLSKLSFELQSDSSLSFSFLEYSLKSRSSSSMADTSIIEFLFNAPSLNLIHLFQSPFINYWVRFFQVLKCSFFCSLSAANTLLLLSSSIKSAPSATKYRTQLTLSYRRWVKMFDRLPLHSPIMNSLASTRSISMALISFLPRISATISKFLLPKCTFTQNTTPSISSTLDNSAMYFLFGLLSSVAFLSLPPLLGNEIQKLFNQQVYFNLCIFFYFWPLFKELGSYLILGQELLSPCLYLILFFIFLFISVFFVSSMITNFIDLGRELGYILSRMVRFCHFISFFTVFLTNDSDSGDRSLPKLPLPVVFSLSFDSFWQALCNPGQALFNPDKASFIGQVNNFMGSIWLLIQIRLNCSNKRDYYGPNGRDLIYEYQGQHGCGSSHSMGLELLTPKTCLKLAATPRSKGCSSESVPAWKYLMWGRFFSQQVVSLMAIMRVWYTHRQPTTMALKAEKMINMAESTQRAYMCQQPASSIQIQSPACPKYPCIWARLESKCAHKKRKQYFWLASPTHTPSRMQ